ncbi:MAG: hypothetical protein P5702_20130 [Limnospira sp. PMC 1291.21]|uniref:Uncharacterized protein n=1 Tax=Limnospira fusiformis PMC 851.14 TaxID=2219512 RepID=A0ABU9ESX7_LIMFS|nr:MULTISPECIES: hypothetical protein [Limnospira]MDY7051074.1 hypothetical protein [Limnospira fusiformis LS22]QJB29262.1 hypothetical protein HFV01_29845 [Limnospira fusiformis SAG 85.79]MDT9179956.1 hypothetical protein [Limnospira sp. PMC 1238.20]MDT9187942.1 hypothetical protein [Limnospira sp. PMC 894.15]MDT9195201.1 hypothetical protein [Limnospira sp. PMC 1245.20]
MRKETRCPQIFTLETQRFSPGCKSDRPPIADNISPRLRNLLSEFLHPHRDFAINPVSWHKSERSPMLELS